MATVLLHQIRSAASLGPSPTGEIVIDADAARTTVQLTTPDVREIVTALTRSDNLDAVYKQRDDARAQRDALEKRLLREPDALATAIRERDDARAKERAGIEALAKAMSGIDRLTEERDGFQASLLTVGREKRDGIDRLTEERDDARAHVDRLAHLVRVNRDTIAMSIDGHTAARVGALRAEAAYAAEKSAHGDTHRALVTAIFDRDAHSKAHDEAVKALAEANARIHELETSAEPHRWLRRDRRTGVVCVYDRAPKSDDRHEVVPLYRHPPRPAGKPVVWAIVFPEGHANCYATEFDARQSQSFGRGRLIPLYEATPPAAAAPPSGCVDHGPDGVGC